MDDVRSRIYGEIWAKTKEMTARGEAPPPFPDQKNLFSLTFIACRRPELAAESDFSAAFVDALARYQADAAALAPNLTPAPRERFHITLFPLYLDRPSNFFTGQTPDARRADLETVRRVWDEHRPLRVAFQGLNLTPDGTLIAQGFDLTGRIDKFRAAASDAVPGERSRSAGLLHVTLARSLEPATPDVWRKLVAWVESRRTTPIAEFSIDRPTFKATSDRQGVAPHDACERELADFSMRG